MFRTPSLPRPALATALVAGGVLVTAAPALAQNANPGCFLARGTVAEAGERSSPLDSASVTLGGQDAKICYGSPAARGRVVMGELVPFGELWRTGANEATGLHVEFPAEIAGIEVTPGSYSLYTVPGEDAWTIYLSAEFERWGIPVGESVRAAQVGEAQVPATTTEEHVENMTFSFERVDDATAHLILTWENTRVEIPVRRRGM